MSFCSDCFKGVRHEGTPEGERCSPMEDSSLIVITGKIEQIGGAKCYVATPTADYPKDKVVLFMTDAFGLSLPNNLLLADDFARNGFKCIMPDILNGDDAPADLFEPNRTVPWDLNTWFASHGTEQTRPVIDKVVTALKAEGVTGFAATGYCFGARYVFDIAFDGITKASAVSHPSLLVIPDDLEKYSKVAKAPLLINSCSVDKMFPLDAQAKADEILGDGKFAPGYHREFFEGCTHGFAVRGDLSDPKVKAGKEGSFKACVDWFSKHL
ncbi:Alpha/Beta hydrolase protein [Mycena pura]|uniref:Alpha/Beta hydrolase protein n=1 Tax=Mycena pura TaxID=153505 RepID=A0AAD6V798_9AGAR|nr:Alpha/Beta hydrolase protein [Mycena pura]